jgi:two-component system phosphate regulon sensor histidine kinase PhoR
MVRRLAVSVGDHTGRGDNHKATCRRADLRAILVYRCRMARHDIPRRRVFTALAIVAAVPIAVLVVLELSGLLQPWPTVLASLATLVGLYAVLRIYLADVASAGSYVDALVRGEDAPLPALHSPGAAPELAEAMEHLKQSWDKRRAELESLVSAHESVLDSLPDPLMRVDEQRNLVRANIAARKLLGDRIVGRDLAQVLRNPALLEAADRVIAGETAAEVEFTITTQVQSIYIARIARLPTRATDGTIAIVALHDLTAIKRSEQLRVDFVANASHELRTPLAVLLGCLDTLEGPARDDAPARNRFITEMRQQATRMSRLVQDLLSLSRIELDEHRRPEEEVDLARLVRSVADTMRLKAMADKVTIELDVPEDEMVVSGDDEQLTQVFQNLIDNAIKYGGKNATVRVSARAIDGALPPGLPVASPAVAIAVADQGEGIPEADIPRLTERFYRVDKARSRELGGTGLGLAIVKHVVNRHRGALRIESVPGQGSTFTVYLPKVAQPD